MCGCFGMWTLERMTSAAEVLHPQYLQHLSCFWRHTRACQYVDKGSAVAGVAKSRRTPSHRERIENTTRIAR